jgi:hypothetical protein
MKEQEQHNRLQARRPHPHRFFFQRPDWTRRRFFEVAGAGITAAFLGGRYARAAEVTAAGVSTRNTARNVIFVLCAGAPSQTDTFDFKLVPGVTPASFAPDTIQGVYWPAGLMPKLAAQLGDIAIVRSMRSWALVHSLSQTWTQIGRNPLAALGNIAPNIGSVVAIEKDRERTADQVFPTFLALNSAGAAGPGYLPAIYAPFKVAPSARGLANTANPDGQTRFANRWDMLHTLDDPLRQNSPYGKEPQDYDAFYKAARGLMYNPVVNQAFAFSSADSTRYGGSTLGNSCLTAVQVLKANQGARFIQITSSDGWDMHQNIYDAGQLPAKAKILDTAIATMIDDLRAAGLLSSTLIVVVGEFGRTVGALSGARGRDHFPQQFAMFAGGGVKGGRVIGSTNATGSDVADGDYGWKANRYVRPEDVEATIYSAVGIDWTTIRRDDPFGRGFEYVPFANDGLYEPIHELWG